MSPSSAQLSSTPDSDGKLCLENGVKDISQYSEKAPTIAYYLLKLPPALCFTLGGWFAVMRPNFKLSV